VSDPDRKLSRRERYAQETRRAIIDAARGLFAERGYFAAKVDEIAAQADVAPATVYAVAGSKPGLIAELIRQWAADPRIAETMSAVASAEDPREIIRILATAQRAMREDWADVIWILLTTAPHDETVAEHFRSHTEFYRSSVAAIARRIEEIDGLRKGIDGELAADVLWFYFGYGPYIVLHDQRDWTYDSAEQWLVEQASHAVLSAP